MKLSNDARLSIEFALWQLDNIPEAIELDSDVRHHEEPSHFAIYRYSMVADTELGLLITSAFFPRDAA